MKRSLHKSLIIALGIISLIITGCVASPASSTPTVDIGYLYKDNYDRLPTAFVAYEPGMVVSASYSPPAQDNTVRHSFYKETITYASGKTVEVEFFITKSDAEGTDYEASINGKVTKVPDIKDYLANLEASMKDKMAFTFVPYPGSWQEPLMKFPPLCPEAAQMHEKYSPFPGKDWMKSLDSITLQCPSTGKTHAFEFSYVREETGDPYIKSFTVKISETTAK